VEPVTVCVAAIANNNGMFVASDRMKTSGDIQYEPEVSKIIPLTTSIVMLTAGDSQLNNEIAVSLREWVAMHVRATPDEWIPVRRVVDWYVWQRQELKRKAAEAALLHPLGLTTQTFLASQKDMDPSLAQELARNIIHFAVPPTQVIIAGIDTLGPHIYTVSDGFVAYHNAVGFAAIGVGSWHVESEFMLSGHHPARSIPETVSLVYRAKRRAETAPGVGAATDLGMMIAGLGSYAPVGDHVQEKLGGLYDKMAALQKKARDRVHVELEQYVRNVQQAQKSLPAQESDGSDGSVDSTSTAPPPIDASGAPPNTS
jgi:hypothetical protein